MEQTATFRDGAREPDTHLFELSKFVRFMLSTLGLYELFWYEAYSGVAGRVGSVNGYEQY